MPSCLDFRALRPPGFTLRRALAFVVLTVLLWVGIALTGVAPAYAHTTSSSATSSRSSLTASTTQSQRGRSQDATATEATMPPDIAQILKRGKLVVAVLGNDNAPFFMDTGEVQPGGLDIRLAQEIAAQLDVTLELNRTADTFNGVVDTVYNREADLAISKISRTLKRARRVRFSHPYLQMRQGLLVNRLLLAQQTTNENVVEAIRQLTGDVGVITGSSYVGFLQQRFPKATIVELESWEDIVAAVSSGEILAGYRDELEIKKVVLTKPDAALQLKTAVLTDTQDSLAMVLPWDSSHLLAFVNQYLDTLETDLTVDGILEEFSSYWEAQKPAS